MAKVSHVAVWVEKSSLCEFMMYVIGAIIACYWKKSSSRGN